MLTPEETARDRARLLELLTRLSYRKQRVKLASGRESDFYIDVRQTALAAEGHFLIGRLLLDRVLALTPPVVAVGGATLGADPLASAVSLTSWVAGRALPAFLVRKEPKGHGTGQWIEGRASVPDGARVALVEDVVTTGGTTLRTAERVREERLVPAAVIAVVDRDEGGRAAIEAAGLPFQSLFVRADFP
jgi:orotate phosphoribosyltransferase